MGLKFAVVNAPRAQPATSTVPAYETFINTIIAIAGAKLWSAQIADWTGYNDGEMVATWPDRSGNSRDWTASGTPALGVSSGPNSRAAVVFDTIGDRYTVPSMLALSEAEMVVVLATAADPQAIAARTYLGKLGSAVGVSHYPYIDNNVYSDFGTDTQKTLGNPTPNLTTWHVFNQRSAASNFSAEINKTAFTYSTGTNTPGFSATPMIFGRDAANSWFGNGALVLMFSTLLTAGERTQILDAIAVYYGITYP